MMNMNSITRSAATALLCVGLILAEGAEAREQIRIVGSSTVYPFSTAVAEEFGRNSKWKAPIVESTGTGGGLKLFCAGTGISHPDIANASRRIKKSEFDLCHQHGVDQITETMIGFDGIVVAGSKTSPPMALDLRKIFLALAKQIPGPNGSLIDNPNKTWRDVDPALPDRKIEVLGPPPTSGTRDAFNELALEGGCKTFPELAALKDTDKNRFKAICRSIREDGAYVEAGENDNLIVQKIVANPDALGVFGFSFLEQNADAVRGNTVGGVEPTFENISDGSYPISRSLYFYTKGAHADAVPGIREFLIEFTSEKALGEFGYLTDKGLIPAPEDVRQKTRDDATNLANLELGGEE